MRFNIVGNYLLIGGHFGFPALGIKGAAIATIIAQGISCIWALSFLFGKKSLLKMRPEFFKVKKKVLLPIMALGVSPFTMSITESLIQISFNNQLSKYGGTMAVGTVAIMFSLWQFVTLPTQGCFPCRDWDRAHSPSSATITEPETWPGCGRPVRSAMCCAWYLLRPSQAL